MIGLDVPGLARRISVPVGVGVHRAVFTISDEPNLVIKVAHRFHNGSSNRREYELYNGAPAELRAYLCPAVGISSCGLYLLMIRGRTFEGITDKLEIPDILRQGDWQKGKNWVMIGGSKWPVRCDYADLKL